MARLFMQAGRQYETRVMQLAKERERSIKFMGHTLAHRQGRGQRPLSSTPPDIDSNVVAFSPLSSPPTESSLFHSILP